LIAIAIVFIIYIAIMVAIGFKFYSETSNLNIRRHMDGDRIGHRYLFKLDFCCKKIKKIYRSIRELHYDSGLS